MSANVQYAALARLLTHNNRVHDLEDLLNGMQVPMDYLPVDLDADFDDFPINPLAELQDEMDRETRASLVTCWLAMPAPDNYEPGH